MSLLAFRVGDSLSNIARLDHPTHAISELGGRANDVDRLQRGEVPFLTITSDDEHYVVAPTREGIDAFVSRHMVAAVVIVRDRSALILQRGPTAPWMPLAWNLPGGGVDAGETTEEAAVREAYEEAGIPLDPHALTFLHTFNGGGWFLDVYAARTASRALPTSAPRDAREALLPIDPKLGHPESCSYEWVTARNIDEFHFVPFVKEAVLRALRQYA
jgi:8-oxo-dGTP pyrophosphatase MutT (NUDIX family)